MSRCQLSHINPRRLITSPLAIGISMRDVEYYLVDAFGRRNWRGFNQSCSRIYLKDARTWNRFLAKLCENCYFDDAFVLSLCIWVSVGCGFRTCLVWCCWSSVHTSSLSHTTVSYRRPNARVSQPPRNFHTDVRYATKIPFRSRKTLYSVGWPIKAPNLER